VLRHREWEAAFPGLVAGITASSPRPDPDSGGTHRGGPTDFGLSTGGAAVEERYVALGRALDLPAVAVGRQVHGTRIAVLEGVAAPGLQVERETDGLVSPGPGRLLCATVADCVPVYLVAPATRSAALVHAGWRGAASGVVPAGVEALLGATGGGPGDLHAHLGPAICGDCYEVGGDVLGRFGRPSEERGRLDLRERIAEDLVGMGVPASRVTVSRWCTRCDAALLHSHRAGGPAAGRMAAFLGWRPA
jgi:YfiH family protein